MAVNFSHAKIVNGKSEENVFSFGFQHLIPAVIITLNRMHSWKRNSHWSSNVWNT